MAGSQKKIIVVDDNLETLTAIKETLKDTYEVYPSPSAFKMFDLLEHITPDLILLDVEMPEMNGYEAATKMQSNEKFKHLPFMFLTSKDDLKSEMEGLELGAVDYIHKPFVAPLLVKRIKAFLYLMDYENREIEYRERLLSMVNGAANVLLSTNEENSFESSLMNSLGLLGVCLDVDRVQIWRNEMIGGELHFVHQNEWLSEYGRSCAPVPIGMHFPYSSRPGWEELFLRGECINATISERESDSSFFSQFGVKSILIIPLFLGSSFWGGISIDDCRRQRKFKDDEVSILSSLALMISNAINRNLQDSKIKEEGKKSLVTANWYQSILNAISLPISIQDTNKNWTFVNLAFRKVFDIRFEDVIGKPCNTLQIPLCNTPECSIECVKKGIKKTYFVHKGLSYEVDVDALLDIDNNLTGYIEVAHDITDLKDMAKKQADAEAANIAKSAFLARMSHEIRSPMNVILGITEMQLQKKELPPDIREALGKVYNSGYMLLKVINDVLDLSKIEANKLELTPVNYDVASLINDIVQLNIGRFESKSIEFELRVDERLPAILVGDELRIKQILNNILSNAYKYTESGKVSFSVSVGQTPEQGEPPQVMLVFNVKDTGQGMTQEQIDKLFDEYTRFNLEANRATEGTGLGMSITKNLVSLMNGDIHVESELGKGSVFIISLPQGAVDGAGVFGKEKAESFNNFTYTNSEMTKKIPQIVREYMPYGKILVVDDMEPNLYVARGLMSPYGLAIETATSGVEAVKKIKNGAKYDIIFMDHFMPVMDGVEATKTIRGLGYTQPIVALTANALTGQAEKFLANGFDDFISKPIDIRQLNETLNKLVRDRYPAETVELARKLKESMTQSAADDKKDLSKMRALVVDDFLPNLNVATGILRKYKMQVDGVLSGQEAINLISSGDPVYNLIFMDHLMPGMDGIETARQIRTIDNEYAKNIPIVALTADTSSVDGKMFLDNGFQAFISKPLSLAKVDTFIKDWISDKNVKNDKNTNISGKKIKEEKMVVDIPGVSQSKIMELYGGDMEIYLPVLQSYLSVIPAALDNIRSVSAETLESYMISVHGIKSTSDSIGAEEARKMAAELEALAKAGDLSGILAKNNALISYVETLLTNIKTWLK